jgi:F420-dependent oxidoreductase-like protein
MLEAYTTLGYLAARTSKVELLAWVTAVTYRDPGMLAKIITTLDVLSKGRAWLGIGAAWNGEEAEGLGLFFPGTAERFERLEETLQICLQMWSDSDAPYDGKHYQLGRTLNMPQSLQRPHPRILIGGGGEKKTLRLVAQYADACNLFARLGDAALKHKLDVLREHCAAVGRPYEAIEKTTLNSLFITREGGNGSITPAQAVEQFASLAAMGVDQAIFSLRNVYDPDVFDLLATEVIPQVERMPVAGRA